MGSTPDDMPRESHRLSGGEGVSPRARRALWFVGLWCAGVLAVAALAYGLRIIANWAYGV